MNTRFIAQSLLFGFFCISPKTHSTTTHSAPTQKTQSQQTLERSIPQETLEKLFTEWTRDPILRMPDAGAHCFNRAQILAKQLEDKGFHSRLLEIQCPSYDLWGVNPDTGTVAGPYLNHYAVIVDIKDQNNVTRSVVLDPQFMQTPVSPEDYYAQVSPMKKVFSENVLNSNQNVSAVFVDACSSAEKDRRYSPKESLTIALRRAEEMRNLGSTENLDPRLTPPLKNFDDRILSWNETELRENIDDIKQWNSIINSSSWFKKSFSEWPHSSREPRKIILQSMLQEKKRRIEELKQHISQTETALVETPYLFAGHNPSDKNPPWLQEQRGWIILLENEIVEVQKELEK